MLVIFGRRLRRCHPQAPAAVYAGRCQRELTSFVVALLLIESFIRNFVVCRRTYMEIINALTVTTTLIPRSIRSCIWAPLKRWKCRIFLLYLLFTSWNCLWSPPFRYNSIAIFVSWMNCLFVTHANSLALLLPFFVAQKWKEWTKQNSALASAGFAWQKEW